MDARRKTYSCSRRSKKWCHRLFYFLVNISMVNAYLLHQNNTHSPRMKIKDSILELAMVLLTTYSLREKKGCRSLEAPNCTSQTISRLLISVLCTVWVKVVGRGQATAVVHATLRIQFCSVLFPFTGCLVK